MMPTLVPAPRLEAAGLMYVDSLADLEQSLTDPE